MGRTTMLSAEARRRLREKVRSQWDTQQQINSRDQAKALVHQLCTDMGLSPANVWRSIEKRTPAGLFILHLLDANVEATLPRHRPAELVRRRAIYETVQQLLREGAREADAFRKAPALLAKREPPIVGPDGTPMLPKSVRNSYRKVDLASIWFQDPTFAEEPASPMKQTIGEV